MARRTAKIKTFLTAVLVLSLAAVFWFFLHSQNRSALRLPLPKAATDAIMALSHVRQTATKDGLIQWQLEADTAELEADTGKMVLRSPRIDFFMKDGGQVRMTAEKGVLNTHNNNMEVRGHVRLYNGRYTLVTEQLAYEHELRIITARTPVQIDGQAIRLHAAAMTYDLKTDQARFNGPVEGILHENPVM